MARIEQIAMALRTGQDRTRDRPSRPSVQVARGAVGSGARRTTIDDVSLVACFLALIGVLVLGGLLALFSWMTSALPTTPTVACTAPDPCVLTVPADIQFVRPDDSRLAPPERTP